MKFLGMSFLLIIYFVQAYGQRTYNKYSTLSSHTKIQKKARYYASRMDSVINLFRESSSISNDSLTNPYYMPLFGFPIYYYSPAHYFFKIGRDSVDSLPKDIQEIQNEINRSLLRVYVYEPGLIRAIESEMQSDHGIRNQLEKDIKPEVKLALKIKDIDFDIKNEQIEVITHRPNFWKISGNYSLQFMQNYISKNWYNGGESNNSLLATVTIDANYNNKQKVQWENKLELKLGFQSSRDDKIHEYKTHSDQIRLTNKLGLQAIKYWYYTLALQSWTQFYPGYKANDENVYSDFMSPFESLFSIGMDYKPQIKNLSLSANIAPFACDFKYVDRKRLASSFGLRTNKHSKFDFGSNITVNYTWNVLSPLKWIGRIYYFTDYSRSQIEWENTFELIINKYLSTKVFIHPRFDDGAAKNNDDSYLQFKEWISLGLNMNF